MQAHDVDDHRHFCRHPPLPPQQLLLCGYAHDARGRGSQAECFLEAPVQVPESVSSAGLFDHTAPLTARLRSAQSLQLSQMVPLQLLTANNSIDLANQSLLAVQAYLFHMSQPLPDAADASLHSGKAHLRFRLSTKGLSTPSWHMLRFAGQGARSKGRSS